MDAQRILLIEPDSASAEFLANTLADGSRRLQHVTAGKEGLIVAWRDQVDLIVTELDLPDIDGLELIRKLRKDQRTRRTPLVVLTQVSDPQKTAAAMEAGADRYLLKQPDAVDALVQFIEASGPEHHAGEQPQTPGSPGNLVAFLGARGGVGTSSLAVNLAHMIGTQAQNGQVVLLDLDQPLGSLKAITGGAGDTDLLEFTRLDLAALRPDELKARLSAPQGWSMLLIPGPEHPARAEDIQVTHIGPALQSLRACYRYVLIDLGRSLGPVSRLVLSQADEIVLVFFPDEPGLSAALEIREALFQEGIPSERLQFLSNRPYPAESLTLHRLEERLSGAKLTAVPHMGDNLTLANASHMPLLRRFPDGRGTLALGELATQMLASLGA